MKKYLNVLVTKDEHDIVWLGINSFDKKINCINEALLDDLDDIFKHLTVIPHL